MAPDKFLWMRFYFLASSSICHSEFAPLNHSKYTHILIHTHNTYSHRVALFFWLTQLSQLSAHFNQANNRRREVKKKTNWKFFLSSLNETQIYAYNTHTHTQHTGIRIILRLLFGFRFVSENYNYFSLFVVAVVVFVVVVYFLWLFCCCCFLIHYSV